MSAQPASSGGRATSDPDAELRLLLAELTVARNAASRAEIERDAALALADEYRGQIRALAGSVSWRMTRPYRSLRRLLVRRSW